MSTKLPCVSDLLQQVTGGILGKGLEEEERFLFSFSFQKLTLKNMVERLYYITQTLECALKVIFKECCKIHLWDLKPNDSSNI